MARELLSHAQIRRAVERLRRSVKATEVTPALEEIERDIEHTYGAWLPIRYEPQRARNGRFRVHETLGIISVATQGYYQPTGTSILSCVRGCGLDEMADATSSSGSGSGLGVSQAAEKLAGKLETGRLLRGTGGRYGMISRGLDPHWAAQFGGETLEWWLLGTANDAATRICKELKSCLTLRLNAGELSLARQEAWRLRDETAGDVTYARLALSYGWFDLAAWQLLETLVAYAALTWQEVVSHVLKLQRNQPVKVGRPAPAPSVVELPRQRQPLPKHLAKTA